MRLEVVQVAYPHSRILSRAIPVTRLSRILFRNSCGRNAG